MVYIYSYTIFFHLFLIQDWVSLGMQVLCILRTSCPLVSGSVLSTAGERGNTLPASVIKTACLFDDMAFPLGLEYLRRT